MNWLHVWCCEGHVRGGKCHGDIAAAAGRAVPELATTAWAPQGPARGMLCAGCCFQGRFQTSQGLYAVG